MSLDIEGDNNRTAYGDGNHIGDVIIEAVKLFRSDLAEVVNVLGKDLSQPSRGGAANLFRIPDKIKHNNVIAYRRIIDIYKDYSGKLNAIYDECDQAGTNIRFNTLTNIENHYLDTVAELIMSAPSKADIDIIRENADFIFKKVESLLLKEIMNSLNINVSRESLNISLKIIMVDAFMECKILENPVTNAAS